VSFFKTARPATTVRVSPRYGTHIVQVQNYDLNTVHTDIAGGDGSFTNLNGVITQGN